MNKKEIKARIDELLSSGTAKSQVFARLAGQGISDSRLAYLIASRADPVRCREHRGKVIVLIALLLAKAAIAFFVGLGVGSDIGPNAKWIVACLGSLVPLLFAWGFYANIVSAYTLYILLGVGQLPRAFEGFASSPVALSITIAIDIGMIAYAWYVRQKIFPGFSLIRPKKVEGQYIFVD